MPPFIEDIMNLDDDDYEGEDVWEDDDDDEMDHELEANDALEHDELDELLADAAQEADDSAEASDSISVRFIESVCYLVSIVANIG
jgi:hypothetical protein